MVCYDLNVSCIASTTQRLASFTSWEMLHVRRSLNLDKLGVGGLSSTPPSVRPGGDGFELDLPLTFSDKHKPIVPVKCTPPASPGVATQRTLPASSVVATHSVSSCQRAHATCLTRPQQPHQSHRRIPEPLPGAQHPGGQGQQQPAPIAAAPGARRAPHTTCSADGRPLPPRHSPCNARALAGTLGVQGPSPLNVLPDSAD